MSELIGRGEALDLLASMLCVRDSIAHDVLMQAVVDDRIHPTLLDGRVHFRRRDIERLARREAAQGGAQ